jgi:hypothetical protein
VNDRKVSMPTPSPAPMSGLATVRHADMTILQLES